jgi:universal stress protein A
VECIFNPDSATAKKVRMMAASDEKDRFGDKLANLEKVREDQWAAERDRELLAKLRQAAEARAAAERQQPNTARLFNRILCPLDFEEGSLNALRLAIQLAAQNKAELYLLHICPTVVIPLGGPVTEPLMAEQSARQRLEEIASRDLAGIRYELLVTTGVAAEKVIDVQAGLAADLIVMGTHGRAGLSKLFLGSIAERVVREASCPVLTTK